MCRIVLAITCSLVLIPAHALPASGLTVVGFPRAMLLLLNDELCEGDEVTVGRSVPEDAAQAGADSSDDSWIHPRSGKLQVSGVYPHLAMYNDENECGTGAVVPWQGDLFAITYAPHQPGGSSDKLYRIRPDLQQSTFAGSVGGTPANRMIHRESNQLLIGPYLVDDQKSVRVIPPSMMFGRLTGTARHLTQPASKVYYATMEEGLYEVDVNDLTVTTLIRDGNAGAPEAGLISQLPGYHGKGLYSGQGRLVYANNGERSNEARRDPTMESGALAQWFGDGDWQLVRRNQFTEVTGPGGIEGKLNAPHSDPLWALGWDAKSVILALLENRQWHYYRLPKASHSYDGAHGWNTEWPRIRAIGDEQFLATMHGTFWEFPGNFSLRTSSGIQPRSNYLKVVGDFCRWNDRVVFGCDDSARAEFLNTRAFKSAQGAPRQSNSNLWFVQPGDIDRLGPPIGRGSVWLREDVKANQVSDPFLFSGYDYRQLHLIHHSNQPVRFSLEVDFDGTDVWQAIKTVELKPGEVFSPNFDRIRSAWIRLRVMQAATNVTAHFQFRDEDPRTPANDKIFGGLVDQKTDAASVGLMRSLAYNRLGLVASSPGSDRRDFYEVDPQMKFHPSDDGSQARALVSAVEQPARAFRVDQASVIVEEDGRQFRLPRNEAYITDAAVDDEKPASLEQHLRDGNLALGATVQTSSHHQAYVGSKAVDGSLLDTDRWVSKKSGDHWIEIDLGREVGIKSMWIMTGWKDDPAHAAKNFEIRVESKDGWETVPGGEIRNNGEIGRAVQFDQRVRARRLRIESSDNDFFRLVEFAVFANRRELPPARERYGSARVCREVATERDLLNIHGTFYELPARNAQGLAKLRPIATHNLAIHDFCSHAGLLFLTGIDATTRSEHIFRSDDGRAAVWAGVVDDLWKLGKPRGKGGPWWETQVKPGQPSDPYLMTAYDQKSVFISSSNQATIRLEVDIDGTGLWVPYRSFDVEAGSELSHAFPAGFSAYWVRAVSDRSTTATVQFDYR